MSEDKLMAQTADLLFRRGLVENPLASTTIEKVYNFAAGTRLAVRPSGAEPRAQTTYVFGGSIFHAGTQAIAVPVNTRGVAGKGLAQQFRSRYPNWFSTYKDACKEGRVKIGQVHVQAMGGAPMYIVDFPTKDDWRNPSKLEYITAGLEDLAKQMKGLDITSIALPALGCGLGGLDWLDVVNAIENVCAGDGWMARRRFMVYAPQAREAEEPREEEVAE